jgi:ribosomal protein S18 acetylase RimI-like enzyme
LTHRPRIVEEKRNAPAVARRVRTGLIAHNASKAGQPDYRRLVLSARDAKGRMVGGLTGDLYWNALYVELLWLEEGVRQGGLGRRLMLDAERRARRARKDLIFLSTYSFQAPGFYRKLGFRIFGRIRDYPRGATRFFLVKDLKSRGGAASLPARRRAAGGSSSRPRRRARSR